MRGWEESNDVEELEEESDMSSGEAKEGAARTACTALYERGLWTIRLEEQMAVNSVRNFREMLVETIRLIPDESPSYSEAADEGGGRAAEEPDDDAAAEAPACASTSRFISTSSAFTSNSAIFIQADIRDTGTAAKRSEGGAEERREINKSTAVGISGGRQGRRLRRYRLASAIKGVWADICDSWRMRRSFVSSALMVQRQSHIEKGMRVEDALREPKVSRVSRRSDWRKER